MRGALDRTRSPHPLAEILPSMLREDEFARDLCASVDEVLAPVLLTMDTFACYLDPAMTPDDMVPWLAQWLGLNLEGPGDRLRQRSALRTGSALNAIRGTRRSLEIAVESAFGVPVEVAESGAARWSPSPGGELPGQAEAMVTVTLHPPAGTDIDPERLDAVIRSVKPAHIQHTVVVTPA